jgi:hypothetical protein
LTDKYFLYTKVKQNMCDCNKNNEQIEHYGNTHLNPNEYPIPQDERGIHKCETGMYPCDHFPDDFHIPPTCPINTPISRSHSTDPNKRYKHIDQNTHNVGTGCMNLDCMCPNCNGDCSCAKGSTAVIAGTKYNMMNLVGAALIVFALYYFYINNKK